MGQITVHKTWRSEIGLVLLFFTLLAFTPYLSKLLPFSVIHGEIWRFEDGRKIYLNLPFFWLAPAFLLGVILIRIYDVKYTLFENHLEARYGIVSFKQKVVRIRYNDVRGIEIIQSLTDRLLGIGIVEISTAASGAVDVIMEGVPAPSKLQEYILAKR